MHDAQAVVKVFVYLSKKALEKCVNPGEVARAVARVITRDMVEAVYELLSLSRFSTIAIDGGLIYVAIPAEAFTPEELRGLIETMPQATVVNGTVYLPLHNIPLLERKLRERYGAFIARMIYATVEEQVGEAWAQ